MSVNPDPDLNAAPTEYRSNSVHALIAAMMVRQDQMHAENLRAGHDKKEQLDRIEDQVRKTNGRVTRLEDARATNAARLATGAKVAGALTTLVLFFFGASLKERALLDVASVRKLADEQITAAAAHVAPAPAAAPPVPPALTRPTGP